MTAVAKKIDNLPATSDAMTPMVMLDRAVAAGATPETIEKFMGLHERWEKNQALKEFNVAIASAKPKIKPIVRTKLGHNSKKYVDMASIANAVDPILSEHGLSYRYRSEQGDRITVTCILFHSAGHCEETTLSGPPDKTGSKNDIQAIGSTVTYLERYTLGLALGLAAADDDDGNAAGNGETVNEDQLEKLVTLADEVGADKIKFCKYLKIDALANLPAKRFQEAMDALEAKRK